MEMILIMIVVQLAILYKYPSAKHYGEQLANVTEVAEQAPEMLSDETLYEIEESVQSSFMWTKFVVVMVGVFASSISSVYAGYHLYNGTDVSIWVQGIWAFSASAALLNMYAWPIDTEWSASLVKRTAIDVLTSQLKEQIKVQAAALEEINKIRSLIPNVEERDGSEQLTAEEQQAYKRLAELYLLSDSVTQNVAQIKHSIKQLQEA